MNIESVKNLVQEYLQNDEITQEQVLNRLVEAEAITETESQVSFVEFRSKEHLCLDVFVYGGVDIYRFELDGSKTRF